jgi:hypothetical protein
MDGIDISILPRLHDDPVAHMDYALALPPPPTKRDSCSISTSSRT